LKVLRQNARRLNDFVGTRVQCHQLTKDNMDEIAAYTSPMSASERPMRLFVNFKADALWETAFVLIETLPNLNMGFCK